MKKSKVILLAAALSLAGLCLLTSLAAERNTTAEPTSFQVAEFITIRWDGPDNTCVIRPSGKIDKLKQLFGRYPRPDGVDERVYYMTVAMNAVAKEGYEFAGMANDEIVMRRSIPR